MDGHRDGDVLATEIMARKEYWHDGVSIYMREQTIGFGTRVAQQVVFAPIEKDQAPNPMLHLDVHMAQRLMDDLWDCGLRPSEGSGSAGAMAAVQAHLKDMQRLVFKEKK